MDAPPGPSPDITWFLRSRAKTKMGDLKFACHAPIARSRDGTARKRRAKHSLHHLV